MRRTIASASRSRRSAGVAAAVVDEELAGGARALRPPRDEPVGVPEADLVVARGGAGGGHHAARRDLVHEVEHGRRGAVVLGEVEDAPLARRRGAGRAARTPTTSAPRNR